METPVTTTEKRRLVPGESTTVMFGDREVQAVVVHVGQHSGMVLARVVEDDPLIPFGYIAGRQ